MATGHRNWRFRSGRRLALAGALGLALLGVLGPGVAAAAPGDILVADDSGFGGGVIGVDPASGARTTVSANDAPTGTPGFEAPHGVALEADGDILVADPTAFGGTGGVIRVDPATGARTMVSANDGAAGEPE